MKKVFCIISILALVAGCHTEQGANTGARTPGETLVQTIESSDCAKIGEFLDNGADLNAVNEEGGGLLEIAVKSGGTTCNQALASIVYQ